VVDSTPWVTSIYLLYIHRLEYIHTYICNLAGYTSKTNQKKKKKKGANYLDLLFF